MITSVSLRHYVSTKIFVEYLFLEYLLLSFDLFRRQKQALEVFFKEDFKDFSNFIGKTPALVSLFNKVSDLFGYFEEHP